MALMSRLSRAIAATTACAAMCLAAQSNAQCTGYVLITAANANGFVPGVDDTGNHCDDCTSAIALPFAFNFYGTDFTSANVSSNGTLQFVSNSGAYANECLPSATMAGPSILPFWDDNYTSGTAAGQGIFTTTIGSTPNRTFVIEWRTQFCCSTAAFINDYEVKLHEGSTSFEIIYTTPMSDRASATIGCQAGGTAADAFTQFVCNTAGPAANTTLSFVCNSAVGACCNPDLSCTVVALANCTSPSIGQAPSTTCSGAGSGCPVSVGKCCNGATGACTFVAGAASCSGGNYTANTTCAVACPPTGVCCNAITGACSQIFGGTCPSGSGPGAGTTCGPNSCPSIAACCNAITGGCTTVFAGTCPSGTNPGTGATCNPSPCSAQPSICQGFENVTPGNLPLNWTSLVATGAGADWTVTNAAANTGANAVSTNDIASVSDQVLTMAPINAGGNLILDVWSSFATEPTFDGWVVEFSTDGGGTWTDVGISSWLLNGYNQAAISTNFQSPILGQPAFSGNFPAWTEHACTIPAAVGQQVTIRFRMCSDSSIAATGVTLDDICVYNVQVGSGACCASNGSCAIANNTACTGLFRGVGVACAAGATCPGDAGKCCNNATGACSLVPGASACGANGTYSGQGTSCSTACVSAHSCCNDITGACTAIFGGTCPAGSTQGGGTGCSPSPCSAQPSICEGLENVAPGTLPTGWTSLVATGVGIDWSVVSGTSHTGSNSLFTNDVGSASQQILTMAPVVAAGPLTLDFWSSFSTENTFDGFVVEFSTDGGSTWTDVGQGGWLLNGYNLTLFAGTANPLTGLPAFSGDFPAWTERACSIPVNSGDQVLIRFNMGSDASVASIGVNLDDICVFNVASATNGACCNNATGVCSSTTPGACPAGSTFQNVGTVCQPNPCPQPPSGVCCRGATCTTTVANSAACTASLIAGGAAGASYPIAANCNAGGSTTTPCCYANYNKQNGITVQDIFDFLQDWFAGSRYANTGGTGAPGNLAVQNIFDFLTAWFNGGCS